MRNFKKYFKGFTLVELIIVITILAILSTIAFVSFQNYTKQARDSNRLTTFSNLSSGFEVFYTKVGNYPTPDNPISFTGGNTAIQMGIIGNNISKLIGVNRTPTDPLTNQNYIYSVGGNGFYYQFAGEKEDIQAGIGVPVYAAGESKTAIVKGNYTMDPSLPSLILVKTSVTSSGIFDPNVCFITDGGSNNFSSTYSNCIKKKDMVLKKMENSLVGYWDMETYYQTSYSGVSNVVFIPDMSGNNYDMALSNVSGGFSNVNIFSSSLMGKGVIFDNNSYKLGFSTIKKGQTVSYNGKTVNYVSGNVFNSSYNNSGSLVLPGISSTVIFDYNSSLGASWSVKRMASWNLSNESDIDSGDFLKLIDGSFFRFDWGNLHEHITPYSDGSSTLTGTYGQKGCGNNNSTIEWDDLCWGREFSKFQPSSITGKNILTANISFSEKKYCLYLNGNKFLCESLSQETINRIQEGGYKYGFFHISSPGEPFAGIIDEVKIYNRALSNEEIIQQARIAGF